MNKGFLQKSNFFPSSSTIFPSKARQDYNETRFVQILSKILSIILLLLHNISLWSNIRFIESFGDISTLILQEYTRLIPVYMKTTVILMSNNFCCTTLMLMVGYLKRKNTDSISIIDHSPQVNWLLVPMQVLLLVMIQRVFAHKTFW